MWEWLKALFWEAFVTLAYKIAQPIWPQRDAYLPNYVCRNWLKIPGRTTFKRVNKYKKKKKKKEKNE
jgi:hypothetical protein